MKERRPAGLQEIAGRAVQFRMAQSMVDIMGRDRLTPEAIKNLARPLNMGVTGITTEGWDAEQEDMVRRIMARFIGMVAWIAADGNQKRTQELIGSSLEQIGMNILSPQFFSAMQRMRR